MCEFQFPGTMQFAAAENYEHLSRISASLISQLICENPDMLLIAATGATPTGTYRLLVDYLRQHHMLPSRLRLIELDEWADIPCDHPSTCFSYLKEHLTAPLQIPEDKFSWFSSNSTATNDAARHVKAVLDRYGPAQLAVLGIGTNGHIGLNEPGPFLNPGIHVAELHETTTQHQMLTSHGANISRGYTLGMADLMQTKKIVLLVSGSEKGKALADLLDGRITTQAPASLLHMHPDVVCIYDQAAYSEAVRMRAMEMTST